MDKKLRFDFKVTQQIVKQISIIEVFKGRWSAIEQKENRYLKELRYMATIESIGSSTRIEGATLSDEEVKKLLKSIKISKFKSRDEQEVVGYYEALDIILDNYDTIKLSENYIKQLHGILLKHSNKDTRHRGHYKNLSNHVVANYPGGKQALIFKTTEPHLTGKEMEELVEWTNSEFEKGELHPLIIIAAFVYEFLSIHPFQDGNGRLSRLLTTLLLMQHGYGFVQYVSFEGLIEERKKDYYKALMTGQKNRYKSTEKIDQWIVFFFDCMTSLIAKLEQKYQVYNDTGAYLNNRQKKVLNFIGKNAPVKLSDIVEATGLNRSTLKKDLSYLVSENHIYRRGQGRGTVYLLKPQAKKKPSKN
jgi:Fic family protein